MKLVCLLVLVGLLPMACSAQDPTPVDPETVPRLQSLRQLGVDAPLAILPVHLLGRGNVDVADAIALVLEQQGMSDLRVAAEAFAPPERWEAVPQALAEHVRKIAPAAGAARHFLFAQFLGDPRQGPTEVRFVVVDDQGERVLVDRQTPADADFQRTAGRDPDPLGCSTLVAERLFARVGWHKVAGGVPNGPVAERWRLKSGAPDAKERAAMQQRVDVLRDQLATAKLVVLAPLGSAADDHAAGERFAAACAKELGCQATAAVAVLQVGASPNQQRRLWTLAASAHAWLTDHPIDGNGLLVADIGLDAGGTRGYVNFVLLDQQGKVVLAEYDNDQSPLYQKVAPKSPAAAEAIVLARLRERLR